MAIDRQYFSELYLRVGCGKCNAENCENLVPIGRTTSAKEKERCRSDSIMDTVKLKYLK